MSPGHPDPRADGAGATAVRPAPARRNGAAVIARRLFAAGCRLAFGIPGGEVLELVRALRAAGIEFVLARHENAAGFMAEGSHHAQGAPALLVATLGPGVANAVNVVTNAWQDRVPMIFLTGCIDAADAHTYTHQVLDHGALLRPVTKASFTVTPDRADVVLDKALAIAGEGQPGPVHVDVPIAVAAAAHRVPGPAPAPGRAGVPAAAGLSEARERFAAARRPLLIAGLDVLNQGCAGTLAALAERHAIPLITTYKAKGVLAEDHPLALGAAGLSPRADAVLLPLVAQSDLVVLAGYDPIEMRLGWRDPFAPAQAVVEFAAATPSHGMHRASWRFVGDVGGGLEALCAGPGPAAAWPGGEPAVARAALVEAFAPARDWGAGRVIATARAVLPRDTVASVDSGAHRILLSQMWHCYAPRTLLQSTGLCTMGCALPLAAGYKRARPASPVVAFTGDAGLEMVAGELATLRDGAYPVIVIVFVDNALALIELKQRRSGHPPAGVALGETDYPALAAAFDLHGAWVDDEPALRAELRAALARPRSTVLACRIGSRPYDGAF